MAFRQSYPDNPLPRIRRIIKVSKRSSRWWAVTIKLAPHASAARFRKRRRSILAASSRLFPRYTVLWRVGMSTSLPKKRTPSPSQSCRTPAYSDLEASLIPWFKCATQKFPRRSASASSMTCSNTIESTPPETAIMKRLSTGKREKKEATTREISEIRSLSIG